MGATYISTSGFYWYQTIDHTGSSSATWNLANAVSTERSVGGSSGAAIYSYMPVLTFVASGAHVVIVAGVNVDPSTDQIVSFDVYNPWDQQGWFPWLTGGNYFAVIPYNTFMTSPDWWGSPYKEGNNEDPDPYIGQYSTGSQVKGLQGTTTSSKVDPAYASGADTFYGPVNTANLHNKMHHWISNYVTIQAFGNIRGGYTYNDQALDENGNGMTGP